MVLVHFSKNKFLSAKNILHFGDNFYDPKFMLSEHLLWGKSFGTRNASWILPKLLKQKSHKFFDLYFLWYHYNTINTTSIKWYLFLSDLDEASLYYRPYASFSCIMRHNLLCLHLQSSTIKKMYTKNKNSKAI